jgi:hypothetical protein
MEQTKQHRPIGDIWNELSKHPDFVAGAYYDKETLIDIIANEIGDDYDDDDKLFKDAEVILNNNFYQIQKNVENCWEYGQEQCIFTDDCDLLIPPTKED